jgi:hypothetical protein
MSPPPSKAIIAEIEAEQALVAANRELIARFEQKIQATLTRVWGEATPADVHAAPPADPPSQQDIYNETLIVNS